MVAPSHLTLLTIATLAGCVAPPVALLPAGPLRGNAYASRDDLNTGPDPSGIVEATASTGSGLGQLEGRAFFVQRLRTGSVRLLGGAGLVASSVRADATSGPKERVSSFGGMPVVHVGLELHGCAVTLAGTGGYLAGPTVSFSGGVAELGADCTRGPWTFGLRGLAHTYSSQPQDSSARAATAIVSFRPRWGVVTPTVSLLVAARHTRLVDTPTEGDPTRYDDRGWLAGLAVGVALEAPRR